MFVFLKLQNVCETCKLDYFLSQVFKQSGCICCDVFICSEHTVIIDCSLLRN